jgi:hypothetical protein
MIRQAALGLLGGMALAACAYQITGYTHQPDLVRNAVVNRTTITVNWTDDVDEISKICGSDRIAVGCAKVLPVSPTMNLCTIWVPQPKDFNDEVRLAILGHEALHCFGADHARS